VRTGRRTRRSDDRALQGTRSGSRTRYGTPRGGRPGRLRRLDAAPPRPRHEVPGRRPEVRHRVRRGRARVRGQRRGDRRGRTGAVRDGVDLVGGRVPARREGTPPRRAVPQPRPRRHLEAAARRGRRGGGPGGPDRGGAGGVAVRVHRRGPRTAGATAHHGHQRRAPHRHPHSRRPGLLVRVLRGPGDVRLERLDALQGRPLEPGPGLPPATRPAPARVAVLRVRRLRPSPDRGLQARDGRPGGLVRGRGRGRRTAGGVAVGRLQRGAAGADR
jgi:hypothetical protein